MTLIEAIARQEGFFVSGSRAARNHNPGNIEYQSFAKTHGAIGSDGRFAIFSHDAAGFAALHALLTERYKGLTIEEALNIYAPPIENQTNMYVRNVCEWMQIQSTDVIDQYLA